MPEKKGYWIMYWFKVVATGCNRAAAGGNIVFTGSAKKTLEKEFLEEGGLRERMSQARIEVRKKQK